ncbi:hypothetical protein V4C53_35570 [Paraburkholderia azotifigens]|uniref:hypothetical protein n=1 Tax=Paraburkholderia azotifigens TaxID=2057004 RepID=UPI0031770945
METFLIFFLGVLTGLVIGIFVTIAALGFCKTAKQADAAYEFDSGVGYPHHEA